MPTEKVSATLQSETLAAIRAQAGRGRVSAFLEQAAREKIARDARRLRVRAYLAELEAEDPVPPEAREKARRLLRGILGP